MKDTESYLPVVFLLFTFLHIVLEIKSILGPLQMATSVIRPMKCTHDNNKKTYVPPMSVKQMVDNVIINTIPQKTKQEFWANIANHLL